jgi:D-xylose reductase
MGTTTVRDICSYAKIKPAVLQVEIHPYCVQPNLVRMCQEKGIQVTAYSSFGAMSYVDLERHKCGVKDVTFDHPTIKAISERLGKSPAQVLLRWGVQRNIQVIPKSVKVERMQENFALSDWTLTAEDMTAINAMDINRRFNDPSVYAEEGFGLFFPIFD